MKLPVSHLTPGMRIGLFAYCICPYTVGTLVLLSNGDIAQVTETDRNLPFRPVLVLLKTRRRVDLRRELSVVIKRVLTDDEAQAAIIKFKLEL